MAYVRTRGNQLAIVRGVRDAATGKVQQQILLTLYSQEEAREAVGAGSHRLKRLLKDRFPGVKLPWEKLSRAIEEKLEHLPEQHERHDRSPLDDEKKRFRDALCAFTRELGRADAQSLASAAEVIRDNAEELRFVRRLIDWRLKTKGAKPNQYSRDPYGWRLSLDRGIPLDVDEMAGSLYDRGQYKSAKAVFRLLLDTFGEDADCVNYLGLIALEKGELREACAHFERASVIARRSFPRRVAKSSMGRSLETRPYVRALRNLALTQNQIGDYDDALVTCNRLEMECGDEVTANCHRASVALNTGAFEEALRYATYFREMHPAESFVAAFAAHELGRTEEALASFLHGALSYRRAARMLLDEPTAEPECADEAWDWNAGVMTSRAVGAYLRGRGKRTVATFKQLLRSPAVAELLSEMEAVVRRWRGDNKAPGWRDAFDRMSRMKTLAFATEQARRILASYAHVRSSR